MAFCCCCGFVVAVAFVVAAVVIKNALCKKVLWRQHVSESTSTAAAHTSAF